MTYRAITLFVLILSVSFTARHCVAAESPAEVPAWYDETVIKPVVDGIKRQHPEFQLQRIVRNFPERINATKQIDIVTTAKAATVSLHDASGGAALQSCSAPCSLAINPAQPYLLVAYARGYPVETRSVDGWRVKERVEIDMQVDLFSLQRGRYACQKIWAQQMPPDGPARLCHAEPPVLPLHTNQGGYCDVTSDIKADGAVTNIRVEKCSNRALSDAAYNAMTWSVYVPKIDRGQALSQSGVKRRIIFSDRRFD
jgi:hypothetical protein